MATRGAGIQVIGAGSTLRLLWLARPIVGRAIEDVALTGLGRRRQGRP